VLRKPIADVLKVALSSTAATVRLIVIIAATAAIFVGVLWLAHSQGWTTNDVGAVLGTPGELLHPLIRKR